MLPRDAKGRFIKKTGKTPPRPKPKQVDTGAGIGVGEAEPPVPKVKTNSQLAKEYAEAYALFEGDVRPPVEPKSIKKATKTPLSKKFEAKPTPKLKVQEQKFLAIFDNIRQNLKIRGSQASNKIKETYHSLIRRKSPYRGLMPYEFEGRGLPMVESIPENHIETATILARSKMQRVELIALLATAGVTALVSATLAHKAIKKYRKKKTRN